MKNQKKYLWVAGYLLFAILIVYGAIRLIVYFADSYSTEKEAELLIDKVVIHPSPEKESVQAEKVIPDAIDFEALLAVNEDVVGWLFAPDTSIHYPVVQGADNDFYLYRNLEGDDSKAGTLFMDTGNDRDFADANTIIYGHNMKNGSMLHDIVKYAEKDFYEKHPVIYLYTPTRNYEIQLVAGCYIQEDDSWYQIGLSKEEQRGELNRLFRKTTFSSEVEVNADDRLITLSTCTYAYENGRYILIGKLEEN